MAKVQMTYTVPDGELCYHQFEDKVIVKPCKFLFKENWCTLHGASPIVVLEGHSVMRQKLYACKRAEIEEPTPPTPAPGPLPDPEEAQ